MGSISGPASNLYCLVPPELPELREEIARSLPEEAPFEVLLDRRAAERRTGAERRREDRSPPAGIERRLAHDLEGRRFVERRALLVPTDEHPPLPSAVRRYADRVRFVRRDEPRRRMNEADRIRALAARWRERCREMSHEAMINLVRGRTEGRDALAAALGTRDAHTWEHSAAVVWLSLECAAEIGLAEDAIAELHDVALLHDIGKIAIPDAILRKQGPLSDAEWETMRRHPAIGARLLDSVDTLRHIAPVVRSEHERWDGRGYPDGLVGEQIPIASRIVFVCDAYHAMVSHRPYRAPLDPAAARAELVANTGSQFWPEAASALLTVLERNEPRQRNRIAVTPQPRRTARSRRERERRAEAAAEDRDALLRELDRAMPADREPAASPSRADAIWKVAGLAASWLLVYLSQLLLLSLLGAEAPWYPPVAATAVTLLAAIVITSQRRA